MADELDPRFFLDEMMREAEKLDKVYDGRALAKALVSRLVPTPKEVAEKHGRKLHGNPDGELEVDILTGKRISDDDRE